MDAFDWSRLSPIRWFSDVREPIDHPAYLLLAIVLAVGFFVSVYVWLAVGTMFDGHRLKQRLTRRLAVTAAWLCAVGLVILLFRWQPMPLLSKRIWFYAWAATALGLCVYAAYFARRRYPTLLASYEDGERKRRYFRRGSGRGRTRGRRGK